MTGDPHVLSNETGSGWEAALSARGRAASWTPWWQGELPPPPVEPIMLTGGIPDPDSLPVDELIACNGSLYATLEEAGAEGFSDYIIVALEHDGGAGG